MDILGHRDRRMDPVGENRVERYLPGIIRDVAVRLCPWGVAALAGSRQRMRRAEHLPVAGERSVHPISIP